jgi:V-type H+-transporting ATPase subunit E
VVRPADQSLLRLREPALVLRCREADRSLVEAVLEVAKKEYAEKAKVNLPKVIIDGKVYLPPQRNSRDAHGPFWYLRTAAITKPLISSFQNYE